MVPPGGTTLFSLAWPWAPNKAPVFALFVSHPGRLVLHLLLKYVVELADETKSNPPSAPAIVSRTAMNCAAFFG